MSMPQLLQALAPRSRRSLFRDLGSLGYPSSYSHTGRYYTLSSIAEFDADGLCRYQGIGVSRDGTLNAPHPRRTSGVSATSLDATRTPIRTPTPTPTPTDLDTPVHSWRDHRPEMSATRLC